MSRGNSFSLPCPGALPHFASHRRAERVKSPFPEHREGSWRAMLREEQGDQPLPEAWWIQNCADHQPPAPHFYAMPMLVSWAMPRHDLEGFVGYGKRVHTGQSETSWGMKIEFFRSSKASQFRYPQAKVRLLLRPAEVKLLPRTQLWALVPSGLGGSRARWCFSSKHWTGAPLFLPSPDLASQVFFIQLELLV